MSDDIKSAADYWRVFLTLSIPKGASPEVIEYSRRCFYAGFSSATAEFLSLGHADSAQAVPRLEALATEVREHIEDVVGERGTKV